MTGSVCCVLQRSEFYLHFERYELLINRQFLMHRTLYDRSLLVLLLFCSILFYSIQFDSMPYHLIPASLCFYLSFAQTSASVPLRLGNTPQGTESMRSRTGSC